MGNEGVATECLHHRQCSGRPHPTIQDPPKYGVCKCPGGIGQVDLQAPNLLPTIRRSSRRSTAPSRCGHLLFLLPLPPLRREPLGLQRLGARLEDDAGDPSLEGRRWHNRAMGLDVNELDLAGKIARALAHATGRGSLGSSSPFWKSSPIASTSSSLIHQNPAPPLLQFRLPPHVRFQAGQRVPRPLDDALRPPTPAPRHAFPIAPPDPAGKHIQDLTNRSYGMVIIGRPPTLHMA